MSARILVWVAVLTLGLAPSLTAFRAFADTGDTPVISAQYRTTLTDFLELMGGEAAGEQIAYAIANDTLSAIAATGVEINEEIQAIVLEESLGEFGKLFGDMKYLTDLYAPLYAEHFDQKELTELLTFYKSPIGQKTIVALPTIGQAGGLAIQQASLERVPDFQVRVDERLRKAGLIVSK